MNIGVYLSVKFRAFGITFGTYTNGARLSVGPQGIQFSITGATGVPAGAETIFNERGVLLEAWIVG